LSFSLGCQEHAPAVDLSGAEHNDPVMPRRVTLHDLVYDQGGQRPRAEDGQHLEEYYRRIVGAPARVRGGIFAPCSFCFVFVCSMAWRMRSAKRRWEKVGKSQINRDVHICAKTPSDVRPKVDRARKEPSKVKWMSASNVCFTRGIVQYKYRATTSHPHDGPGTTPSVKRREEDRFWEAVWTYEPDEGEAVLPGRVLGEQGARRGRRDDSNDCDAGKGAWRCRGEDRWLSRAFGVTCLLSDFPVDMVSMWQIQ